MNALRRRLVRLIQPSVTRRGIGASRPTDGAAPERPDENRETAIFEPTVVAWQNLEPVPATEAAGLYAMWQDVGGEG